MSHYIRLKRASSSTSNTQNVSNENAVKAAAKKKTNTSVKGINDNSIDHETIKSDDSYTLLIILGAVGGFILICLLIAIIIKAKRGSSNDEVPPEGTDTSRTKKKSRFRILSRKTKH
uniref:Syndecan domain-containing protein n=1 Tax=Strongyloides stercoralis TaxID=6248 RepID=A0A0K0ET56_STRER